ncbi:MAG: PEP-CTERM sorting domain-containing protein [Phycisphaerae bacterium]|nr:PEP-CTERM sorting domain-containing protein [Phycisphaerae bacterium]
MERMARRTMIVAVLAVAGLAMVTPAVGSNWGQIEFENIVYTVTTGPAIDGAIIKTRIFNDSPASVLTTNNNYPSSILINDDQVNVGWANRHNFRLSADGGVSEAVFMNADEFSLFADVTITGTAKVEGGLNFTSWWTKDVDGVFMLKTENGEIACFGGRLPFYSFTANHGLTYTKGETVRQGIIYTPNSLTEADPATIEYVLTQGGNTYTSGPLAYDMGNPDEDPPYGLWGNLNDGRLGGYVQILTPEPGTLALLVLGGLAVLRRR